jgi:hypothetical protein
VHAQVRERERERERERICAGSHLHGEYE